MAVHFMYGEVRRAWLDFGVSCFPYEKGARSFFFCHESRATGSKSLHLDDLGPDLESMVYQYVHLEWRTGKYTSGLKGAVFTLIILLSGGL